MLEKDSKDSMFFEQLEDSLRALRIHIINNRLRLLRLTLQKSDRITDTPEDGETKTSATASGLFVLLAGFPFVHDSNQIREREKMIGNA